MKYNGIAKLSKDIGLFSKSVKVRIVIDIGQSKDKTPRLYYEYGFANGKRGLKIFYSSKLCIESVNYNRTDTYNGISFDTTNLPNLVQSIEKVKEWLEKNEYRDIFIRDVNDVLQAIKPNVFIRIENISGSNNFLEFLPKIIIGENGKYEGIQLITSNGALGDLTGYEFISFAHTILRYESNFDIISNQMLNNLSLYHLTKIIGDQNVYRQ